MQLLAKLSFNIEIIFQKRLRIRKYIPLEQVDVLPSKNHALCDLIYNVLYKLMGMSCE